MKKVLLQVVLAVLLIGTVQLTAYAQGKPPKPPKDNGNKGGKKDPKQIPLDGGLSLLLAAGVGLGAKKMFFDKKQENA
jgi:hypothetical protein